MQMVPIGRNEGNGHRARQTSINDFDNLGSNHTEDLHHTSGRKVYQHFYNGYGLDEDGNYPELI